VNTINKNEIIHNYMSELGKRGGHAGKGTPKNRSLESYQEAGRKGGLKRAANLKARLAATNVAKSNN